MGIETVIRAFAEPDVAPTPFHPAGAVSAPPVRLSVGLIGGTKTFSYSQSLTMTSYMAQVNTEKPSDAFDMTTGKLAQ